MYKYFKTQVSIYYVLNIYSKGYTYFVQMNIMGRRRRGTLHRVYKYVLDLTNCLFEHLLSVCLNT